jgi:hypothetical protein
MKKIENYESVQASSGEFARPSAGGYVAMITNVEDVPLNPNTNKGDYLKIEYDFTEGEFFAYFSDFNKKNGYWHRSGSFFKSYKETALGRFKHFTNCIEKSNEGYSWNFDEKTLAGKQIGLVLGEEEYIANDGSTKTRLYVAYVKTVEQIRNGDFRVPALKKIKQEEQGFVDISNSNTGEEELPF